MDFLEVKWSSITKSLRSLNLYSKWRIKGQQEQKINNTDLF